MLNEKSLREMPSKVRTNYVHYKVMSNLNKRDFQGEARVDTTELQWDQ